MVRSSTIRSTNTATARYVAVSICRLCVLHDIAYIEWRTKTLVIGFSQLNELPQSRIEVTLRHRPC